MALESSLQKFLKYVDDPTKQTNFKERLIRAVEHQRFVVALINVTMVNSVANISVSSNPDLHEEVKKMCKWLEEQLCKFCVDTKQVDLNKLFPTSQNPLPNLVLGKIDGAPGNNLKTVLVYGHYDVQPVSGLSDQSYYILT